MGNVDFDDILQNIKKYSYAKLQQIEILLHNSKAPKAKEVLEAITKEFERRDRGL